VINAKSIIATVIEAGMSRRAFIGTAAKGVAMAAANPALNLPVGLGVGAAQALPLAKVAAAVTKSQAPFRLVSAITQFLRALNGRNWAYASEIMGEFDFKGRDFDGDDASHLVYRVIDELKACGASEAMLAKIDKAIDNVTDEDPHGYTSRYGDVHSNIPQNLVRAEKQATLTVARTVQDLGLMDNSLERVFKEEGRLTDDEFQSVMDNVDDTPRSRFDYAGGSEDTGYAYPMESAKCIIDNVVLQ
jgi:hypothetical protein